ncbi:MAG: zinc-ribbon domain-containing protein [Fibromonadaceae bacterium]|nr:zinc-ribbon domain-containing protein [Fibromonadaceae bacterium]
MFCSNCGYELKEDTNFCPNCGLSRRNKLKNNMNFCPNCGTKVTTTIPSVSNIPSTPFIDLEGRAYKTVRINDQVWMAENLNYGVDGSKCYGEDSELSNDEIQANSDKYGRLYDWETANKICPSGWHLPNNDDWNELNSYICNGIPTKISKVGKYIKAREGWNSWYDSKGKEKSGNGEDRLGFAALPGGCYDSSYNRFELAGEYGCWWSATEDWHNKVEYSHIDSSKILTPSYATHAYYFYMNHKNYTIEWNSRNKRDLCSVRYVKD